MKNVFDTIKKELSEKHNVMLASIVKDCGSVPRGKGSQMVIGSCGRLAGTIGGGSVEFQAEQNGKDLLNIGTGGIKEYVLRKCPDDRSGTVCGGDITVLFTYLCAENEDSLSFVEKVIFFLQERKKGYISFLLTGEVPLVTDYEPIQYETDSSYIIPIPVSYRAIIFGAGHIAAAVAPMLATLGFCVLIYDNRQEFVTRSRFCSASRLICDEFSSMKKHIDFSEDDFCIVATSGHERDFECEEILLRMKLAFVGVVGSKKKTLYVNQLLRDAGITEAAISHVHTPIGLAIKAVTPEEIAVSIAAEMVYERAMLNERKTGIRIHEGNPKK